MGFGLGERQRANGPPKWQLTGYLRLSEGLEKSEAIVEVDPDWFERKTQWLIWRSLEKMKHNLQPKRNKCKILKTKDNLEDYGKIQRDTHSLDLNDEVMESKNQQRN